MTNQLITNVLVDLIRLAVLGGVTYGVAYLRSHYTAKQIKKATGIAKIAVDATEQVASALNINGKDKLDHALVIAKDLAGKAGLHLSEKQWNSLIEAGVKAMKNAGSEIKAAGK